MRRRPEALEEGIHDVVVVGGGIVGACAAWDAALRGLSAALVQSGDFGQGASANNLKILHGGLRYLQHADLARSRESVRERRFWLRAAPHLAEPLPVIYPAQGGVLRSRPALRAALAVNDLLSADRNRGVEADRRIPPGASLSRREVLDRVPELEPFRPRGGVRFHDALMLAPERLVLEAVLAAAEAGATVANHVGFRRALREGGRPAGIVARDEVGGGEIRVRGRAVLNAAGGGAEAVAAELVRGGAARARSEARPPRGVAPGWSSAVNLVLDGMGHEEAFALPLEDGPVLFAVPWEGRTLVGTGHYPLPSPPLADPGAWEDRFEWEETARRDARDRFLERVGRAWPEVTEDRVRLVHWGLLPTTRQDRGRPVDLLPRQRIVHHAEEGAPGVFSAVGVKFTTGRRTAEQAVDAVCRWLGHPVEGRTAAASLPGTPSRGVQDLQGEALREHGGVAGDELLGRLVRSYGARYERVLEARRRDPRWDRPVARGSNVARAQFLHGARAEMGVRPEDLVWRRTAVGPRGDACREALETARELLERPPGPVARPTPHRSAGRPEAGETPEGT